MIFFGILPSIFTYFSWSSISYLGFLSDVIHSYLSGFFSRIYIANLLRILPGIPSDISSGMSSMVSHMIALELFCEISEEITPVFTSTWYRRDFSMICFFRHVSQHFFIVFSLDYFMDLFNSSWYSFRDISRGFSLDSYIFLGISSMIELFLRFFQWFLSVSFPGIF